LNQVTTLTQAGELLLAPPLQSALPLLPAQLRAAGATTGDLVFGHLPQAGDDTEVAAWQVTACIPADNGCCSGCVRLLI
jgi:hypothetical protein